MAQAATIEDMIQEGRYQEAGAHALRSAGGTMKATLSDTKVAPWGDETRYRPHWRITLKGPGGSYTFDYFASINDGEKLKKAHAHNARSKREDRAFGGMLTQPVEIPEPTAYDVIACLPWYDPGTFANFCGEYGYDEDSRKAEQTYRAVKAQAANLARIFPSEADREGLAAVR